MGLIFTACVTHMPNLLKTSGVHVTTAQKLMGHANPGVTLGIYTRFRDEEIDNAGAAIMDSLRGKSDYLMFYNEYKVCL